MVWSDLGLPRTHVTRQRLVMDLTEAPIALQLEWPRQIAVDLLHRLMRVAQKPAWQFHAERRLADVAGQVLREGSNGPEAVQDRAVVEVASVLVSPEDFDNAQPAKFPDPLPLVRVVTYRWTVQPTTPPPGAREAELVRRWRTVDEWARVQVDRLRQALEGMEQEERGFLDRLRTWLPRNKDARQRRSELRAKLDERGEAPPSQQPEEAKEIVQELLQVGREIRQAVEKLQADREEAETAAAEAEQRAEWEKRIRQTQEALTGHRDELAKLEAKKADEDIALSVAQTRLADAEAIARAIHKDDLEKQREALAAELAKAREAVINLPRDADKQRRKECERLVRTREQQDQRLGRELANVDSWSPAPAELAKEHEAVSMWVAALSSLSQQTRACSREIERLEKLVSAPFEFVPPVNTPRATSLPETSAPTIPNESPPEAGELLDFRGKRYLAVWTWEQARSASHVAKRLQAELVFLQHNPK